MDSALAARTRAYGALDLVSQPVWIFDIVHRCVHWANRAALRVWNSPSLEELCGRDMGTDMSESVARRLAQYQADFISHGATFNEQWTLYPESGPVSLNVKLSAHPLDDGHMAMLCEARQTVAEAPESLRSVDALLHTAVMISLYGSDGRPLYRNPASRASVRDLEESLDDRIVDRHALAALRETLDRSGAATRTLAVHTDQGDRWHEISARKCRDAVTGQDALLVSEADVSAIKTTEARAQFLALHDSLTGLPNRSQVMQHFTDAVGQIRGSGQEAALMFLDLDHFKDVNDTLGHAAGDALLVEVARRLRGAVRGGDLVARLGGDEFLIFVVSPEIHKEVDRLRQRLAEVIAAAFSIDGREVHVTPSMGVSVYPRDGNDIETLLRHADLAMYSAKDQGRNDMAFYSASMSSALHHRTALEAELRRAVERREFEVYYQPIVDSVSGRIAGAEALLRWFRAGGEAVPPDVFIPVCEGLGLIRTLGAYVFSMAASQQVAWCALGHDLHVAVNLSPRQLRQPELLPDLQQALLTSGANPARMQLEITESVLLGHDEVLVSQLRAIKASGMSLALDDFGTGYSNLGYLQRFPIKSLKIDKSFIQCIDSNRALAETIVTMCRLMQLSVVAEGVETQDQLDWVQSRGIEHWQGYLRSPALSAAAFTALLSKGRVRASDQPMRP